MAGLFWQLCQRLFTAFSGYSPDKGDKEKSLPFGCPHWDGVLRFFDSVPIFSWLFTGALP